MVGHVLGQGGIVGGIQPELATSIVWLGAVVQMDTPCSRSNALQISSCLCRVGALLRQRSSTRYIFAHARFSRRGFFFSKSSMGMFVQRHKVAFKKLPHSYKLPN